ncbi:ionotropic receptor 93a-like [Panulirus ornatus]|uniref:ionotropic receptor 93a-like n=1 Tax=Panulirus ornatus TaxID=150431 RepID=UPI003A8A283B
MKTTIVMMMMMTFLLAPISANVFPDARMESVGSVAVSAVLEATSQPSCSLILLTDGVTSPSNVLKAVSSERSSPRGVTVMEVTAADGQDANVTLAMLSHLISQARRVRLGSWCLRVVVVSHDPAFLAAFAESSLKGRLLVWATRLLVVTRLTLPQLHALLPALWTFSMMNTIFLNLEETPSGLRVSVYTYLPFNQASEKVLQVATWTPNRGLHLTINAQLFPEKYDNFQGATIPVTALPYPPYWVEEEHRTANGTTVRKYSGTDGELLNSVAGALKFTFYVLPTASWAEADKRVPERRSFISPVYHTVLPQRLERYDVTYTYEYVFMAFGMKKPGLKPGWQSLYYPLADQVWATVLALLFSVPAILIVIIRVGKQRDGGSRIGAGEVLQHMTGMLLGQNLPRRLPTTSSSRLLVAAWLVFAFIIGTVYRCNLTAHLTLPKYPPRPETVEELVEVIDRVTRPLYGAAYKEFFMNSDYEVFQKLGELLVIGIGVRDGLKQALKYNQAVIEGRRYLEHIIAEEFSQPDGTTDLYIGRQHVTPGLAAWIIPHDAPYRLQLNRCIMAVIEAGLYEKWSGDQMAKARQRSMRRQQGQGGEGAESSSTTTALTLRHMQGPLILLFLGLLIGGALFAIEFVTHLYLQTSE